ncbi:MAG: hypothetical protein Q8O67_32060 [Deltaproteobacteria bacterium]|nr:hypothetical protein [Deltaproteobacteria bacterium]
MSGTHAPALLPIAFVVREDPLEAIAVIGFGAVAASLARRLLACPDDVLRRLHGVAGAGVLVALGAAETLPWVDGVTYLGRDPRAPRLLLPTTCKTVVALDVFERAMLARATTLRPPIAVLHSPPRLLSVAQALPIARDQLRAWLEAEASC